MSQTESGRASTCVWKSPVRATLLQSHSEWNISVLLFCFIPPRELQTLVEIDAEGHWSCSSIMWWSNPWLKHLMLFFSLIYHPSVVLLQFFLSFPTQDSVQTQKNLLIQINYLHSSRTSVCHLTCIYSTLKIVSLSSVLLNVAVKCQQTFEHSVFQSALRKGTLMVEHFPVISFHSLLPPTLSNAVKFTGISVCLLKYLCIPFYEI